MDPNRVQRRAEMVARDRKRLAVGRKKEQRRRLAWIVGVWVLFVIPNLILAWFFLRWVALLMLAAMAWATWDYYRKGGMIDSIEATQRAGIFVPGAFDDHKQPH